MEKKVVIITGASAGIGLATAKALISEGYAVYGISRREFSLPGLSHIRADVTDEREIKEAVGAVFEREGRLDFLINNAGMGISGSLENTPAENMLKIFSVNNFGAVYASQAAIPYMRQTGGGTIINICSVAAVMPIPFQAFYAATKSSLLMLSDSLRCELKPFNIKVCAVLPGDVKTDFTGNREKNPLDDAGYGDRIRRSVDVMERDEQNGMSPEVIAGVILKLMKKKNPPPRTIGGAKYALLVFLARFLPHSAVNFIIGKIYGF